MQDFGKIVIGIIVFLALLSIPVIVTQASGNADYTTDSELQLPDPAVVSQFIENNVTGTAEQIQARENSDPPQCIESTDYMRLNHMSLLLQWRTWVVRDDADNNQDDQVVKSNGDGDFYYIASDGTVWLMSLEGTCLGCHTDRTVFCNVCHNYTETTPNCWDCHGSIGGES